MKKIACIFILLLLNSALLFALDSLELTPSDKDAFLYEIHEIKITGANSFTSEKIASIISSQASSISFPHALIKNAESRSRNMMYFPRKIKNIFKKALVQLDNELKYFDKSAAEQDAKRIEYFYNQYGFHTTTVDFKFYGNRKLKKNILEFIISEGVKCSIGLIRFSGLDSIDNETGNKIRSINLPEPNSDYNESQIFDILNSSYSILLNNGYFFAKLDTPIIKIDTLLKKDTIILPYKLGNRYKYGSITMVDSNLNQSKISANLKYQLLDFAEGDWYSAERTQNSIKSLYGLGLFDVILIDTSQAHAPHTDSSLSFIVFNQYKKQKELQITAYADKKTIDNSASLTGEVYYLDRNLFGAAQNFSPFFRIGLQDFSRVFANGFKNAEIEWQLGANFGQPALWVINGQKVGFNNSWLYSIRTIKEPLKLETYSMIYSFPVTLPAKTYINGMRFDFNFERQTPKGLAQVYSTILSDAKTKLDSIQIREELYTYSHLDSFLMGSSHWLTASTITAAFVGDSRDNPFSPTKGRITTITLDFGGFLGYLIPIDWFKSRFQGSAKYIKTTFTSSWYWSLSNNLVSATKIRFGHIFQLDKNSSYIPLDRQFFVGGGSSVRGWPSRQLRYPMQTATSSSTANYISDLVGSSTVIEGSYELRFKFPRLSYLNDFFAEQVNKMGIAVFADYGNAWGSYSQSYNKITFEELTKIAIAGGLGFRYETPIGPFRVDFAWPLFDPSKNAQNTIFSRPKPFSGMVFNIGIGNAF